MLSPAESLTARDVYVSQPTLCTGEDNSCGHEIGTWSPRPTPDGQSCRQQLRISPAGSVGSLTRVPTLYFVVPI